MSKKMTRFPSDRKVYVGDLGNNARKNDLEYVFGAYGTLRSVWIARNPPGFAFVEFEDSRDAADAVRALDGRHVCGRRARVELSTGKLSGRGDRRRGDRLRGGRFNGDNSDKCYECGGRGHYARQCRRRRRSNSRSRSRSPHKSRTRSGSRSVSRSLSSDGKDSVRKSKVDSSGGGSKTRPDNDRRENGDSSRFSEASSSPKRRYDSSSPTTIKQRSTHTKHGRSISHRRGGTSSRSLSNSRRD